MRNAPKLSTVVLLGLVALACTAPANDGLDASAKPPRDASTCPVCSGETPVCVNASCQCDSTSCGTGRSCVSGACVANACTPACSGETPVCAGTTCQCDATSCAAGKSCVAGACVASVCTPACGGDTPTCVGTTCQCNAYSCGTGNSCVGGACATNACTPPCGGDTPICVGATCQCDATSCAYGKSCVAGACVTDACSPACSGDTPDCVGTTCQCNALSCGVGKSCVGGVCVANSCSPSCGDETPECFGSTCRCNATSCSSFADCVDGACIKENCTCPAEAPHCTGSICSCDAFSCGPGKSCVGGACVPNACTVSCNGDTPHCVGTTCRCDATSCGADKTCFNGACVSNSCTPTCSGATPDCLGTECRCNAVSCGKGKLCGEDGACYAAACVPACSGQTPTCDPATLTCTCTATSCTFSCGVNGQCLATDECDRLDPTACPPGQGCYLDSFYQRYSCSDAGTVAAGGWCDTSADCKAGLYCYPDSCSPYCNAATGAGCSGTDVCVDINHGVGACASSCPTTSRCGSACCLRSQRCDPATSTCVPNVACDPLSDSPCPKGYGCYLYYDGWDPGFACFAAGTVALGGACDETKSCVPGTDCFGNDSDYTCQAFCYEPTSAGCGGANTCVSIAGEVGACYVCPAESACGSTCCATDELCDTKVSPSACKAVVHCDLLAPTACVAGQGCYALSTSYDPGCADAGPGGAGATCTVGPDCQAGFDCFGPPGGPRTCSRYCNLATGAGCGTSEVCADSNGYVTDFGVGLCEACPAAKVCGGACCAAGQICDSAVTPNACKDPVSCNPLAPTACDAATEGCYLDSQSYYLFVCMPKGSFASGTPCTKGSDCAPNDDCFVDAAGIATACAPYCFISGANPCTAPARCVPTGISSTIGYCVADPIKACDVLAQTGCSVAGTACYPASNGATNCLTSGTSAEGVACVASTDCLGGMVCTDYLKCQYVCDPAGSPSGCARSTDSCVAVSGVSYGTCAQCPTAKLCGASPNQVCCDVHSDCTAGACVERNKCNPVAQTGCQPTEGCYYDSTALAYVCIASRGTKPNGASCSEDKECLPGRGCDPGFRRCSPMCNAAGANTCPFVAGVQQLCLDRGGYGMCY